MPAQQNDKRQTGEVIAKPLLPMILPTMILPPAVQIHSKHRQGKIIEGKIIMSFATASHESLFLIILPAIILFASRQRVFPSRGG